MHDEEALASSLCLGLDPSPTVESHPSDEASAPSSCLGLDTSPKVESHPSEEASAPSSCLDLDTSPKVESHRQEGSWGVGKGTPALMLASYMIAIIIAILHFVFFQCLSGTPAQGPGAHMEQSYVTTASMLLSSAFGFFLRLSLGVAYTQHLWRLLRLSPFKVMTIESLFSLRTSPGALFDRHVLLKAWPLVVMTVLIWASPVATSFPSGSQIIETMPANNTVPNVMVPTFDPTQVGDGSYGSFRNHTLYSIEAYRDKDQLLLRGAMSDHSVDMRRLISRVLANGDVKASSTFLQPNSSYMTTFTGPYLECTRFDSNFTHEIHYIRETKETINGIVGADLYTVSTPGYIDYFNFTIGRLHEVGVKAPRVINATHSMIDMKVLGSRSNFTCQYSRSDYELHAQYENRVGMLQATIVPNSVQPLNSSHFWPYYTNPGPMDPSLELGEGTSLFDQDSSISKSQELIDFVRVETLRLLIMELTDCLYGNMELKMHICLGKENKESWHDAEGYTYTTGSGFSRDSSYFYSVQDQDIYDWLSTGIPSIDLSLTRLFDNNRDDFIDADRAVWFFNSALLNVTLTAITELDLWRTEVNITEHIIIGVYAFARPLHLILPYSISLLCSLPFIVLGLLSLLRNGVPAMDGGFLQILLTTRGSRALDKLAMGGSLGGERNVPETLKKAYIQYGELIPATDHGGEDTDGQGMKTRSAGFGIPTEILPLKRKPC